MSLMANRADDHTAIPFQLADKLHVSRKWYVFKARRTDNIPEGACNIVVKLIALPDCATTRSTLISRLNKQYKGILELQHLHLVHHLQLQQRSMQIFNMAGECPVDYYCILTEYCQGGTLHDAVQNPDFDANRYAARWTKQIVAGLAFLHANRIVHRDIKGSNIVLSSADYARCILKIGDLGDNKELETAMTRSNEVSTNHGTVGFMSPEIMGGELIGHKGRSGGRRISGVWAVW
ncbi:mitogen-activated protein kinase kinase kinase 3-like isoform X2 [Paramacrobiotus metropolitanus]|nr:mitogen-activated protein kinase kinase kinase 3-like isoform X2 [Paramacrobiotus metropolitanus]XP_055342186.1 mitogen-activated protein kinase kinase kinase 3-like isoform X2 [Paramacrobiotus metropolitanus]